MSVDDWAREQAEKRYPATWQDRGRTDRDDERDAFKEGVGALADAFLSDEAAEAAEDEQYRHGRDLVFGGGCACGERFPLTREGIRAHDVHVARAALQAAVDAVTRERGVVDTSEATC